MPRPDAQALIAEAIEQAVALHQRGWLDQAEALYREILKVSPGHFDALHLLGLINQQCGRPHDALRLIDAALAIDPQSAAAHCNRGAVLNALSRSAEALISLDRALTLRPEYADAHGNRAGALRALDRHQEALASVEHCLALAPRRADMQGVRGELLARLGRPQEALGAYREAVRLAPATAELHNDIGVTCCELGRYDEARDAFAAARAAGLDSPQLNFNEAIARLLSGDYAQGWAQYEARWGKPDLKAQRRRFPQPLWLGAEEVAGKTVLLHAEQGFGDTLQFVRYAPLVAARGATVVLEVQPSLKELMQGLAPTVLARDEPLPPFDLHAPLLSLPHAFRTELATIPHDPYLRAPAGRAAAWASRLGARDRLRVGLAWAGKAGQKHDHARSLTLARLEPLLAADVSFVSLQHELRAGDAAVLDRAAVLRLGERFADFADTAAVIAVLDLVISVDTAVAHLAAAMGKPLWLLLSHGGDWHWVVRGRADSPWYPTARLFRQAAPGDWSDAIGAVQRALEALARPSVRT